MGKPQACCLLDVLTIIDSYSSTEFELSMMLLKVLILPILLKRLLNWWSSRRKDTSLGENDDSSSEVHDGPIFEDVISCSDCSGDSEEEQQFRQGAFMLWQF